MDTVIKATKLRAMKSYHKTQFLPNLVSHLVIALTCSLICFYHFWFPSLSSNIKQFLFLSLPNKLSSFSSSKCLFVVVNIIVVFLVGESKLSGVSQLSSPADEIHEEYVETIRSLRGVSTLQDKAEESKLELKSAEEIKGNIDKEVITEVKKENKRVIIEDFVELPKNGDKEVEEEVVKVEDQEKGGDGEEETGLPTEELNRRVEKFIARVNKQRSLEAQSLFSMF